MLFFRRNDKCLAIDKVYNVQLKCARTFLTHTFGKYKRICFQEKWNEINMAYKRMFDVAEHQLNMAEPASLEEIHLSLCVSRRVCQQKEQQQAHILYICKTD